MFGAHRKGTACYGGKSQRNFINWEITMQTSNRYQISGSLSLQKINTQLLNVWKRWKSHTWINVNFSYGDLTKSKAEGRHYEFWRLYFAWCLLKLNNTRTKSNNYYVELMIFPWWYRNEFIPKESTQTDDCWARWT